MQAAIAAIKIEINPWRLTRHLPALGVVAFGLLLLYGTAFVNLPAAHNATHDARHAAGFPCH